MIIADSSALGNHIAEDILSRKATALSWAAQQSAWAGALPRPDMLAHHGRRGRIDLPVISAGVAAKLERSGEIQPHPALQRP